ncbi:DNA replication protein DnaC [Catenibacillus scindens]|uniref:DNA replication protein DnaC n=1 Tax=Catenibacillus scindens TaxID=673271 RepID=A0A7W8H7X0_9FIRM|nr:ATP-binding protein [Catenibacillus scindens]MBB5263383.1 DNA replication protein DnaC [Catenibacillus scindens]
MPLKNSQYNTILRWYDQLQAQNQRQLEQRQEEIYNAIPEIARLDEAIARTGADYARRAVLETSQEKGHESGNGALSAFHSDMERLNREKSRLLTDHGYPNDYLEPVYHCRDCKDTGFIGSRKCHCFKQAVVDLVYAQSNIRSRLESENFDTFRMDYYSPEKDPRLGISPRENMENVVAACHNFIEHFDQGPKNLLLYGSTGVGKTFLSNCIAKALLDRAHTVIYLTAFQLVDILEDNTFGKDEDSDVTENMFTYILDCDLLIIDDLGTEMNNTFITSQLFLCINERLLRRRSTIISTNLSLDKLQREYSERIFSRIVSEYQVLFIFGEDIRVKKAISS